MRIHTSLTRDDIVAAMGHAGVYLHRFEQRGSRSHERAFDVILEGSSGRRGANGDYQAATWDEWGIFLGYVFDLDPNAKATYYRNADDYHWQTGDRFRTLRRSEQHRNHKWTYDVVRSATGTYFVHGCKCGAIRRMYAGGHSYESLHAA